MAIVKMSKFQLTVFDSDKESVLKALQGFNIVHFKESKLSEELEAAGARRPDVGARESGVREGMDRVQKAVKILVPFEKEPDGLIKKMAKSAASIPYEELDARLEGFDSESVLKAVFDEEEKIRRNQEAIRQAKEHIRDLGHWVKLGMAPDAMRKAKHVRVRTGSIPKRWADELRRRISTDTKGTYIEFLASDTQNEYLILVDNRTDEGLGELLRDSGFVEIALSGADEPKVQITQEEANIAGYEKAIEAAEANLRKLAESADKLRLEYERRSAANARIGVQENFVKSKYLSFLEGYIPTDSDAEFRKAVAEGCASGVYDLKTEAADKYDEEAPILLKNNAVVEPFESIVATYTLPKYSETDPTPLLTWWYMLFFGLMVGDLGYGIVMFIGSLLFLKLLPMKKGMKGFFRFFFVLSIPTMIAGAVFGSVFGGLIPMPALFDPTKNYMPMIIASIAIGLVNIFFGLGIKGALNIRDGKPMDAVYDVLFWYMALGGAIVFGLAKMAILPEMLAQIGMIVMIVGMVGIVLFSARENKGFTRYTWGLYNLYGITSYVGDLVSYSRIAALMLSGAFIGSAVNMIAEMLSGIGFIGVIIGIFVLVFFHAFNLFLSGLSAYVHSMRLIYVEFFGKFYEGGGMPFRKLRPKSKYVELE